MLNRLLMTLSDLKYYSDVLASVFIKTISFVRHYPVTKIVHFISPVYFNCIAIASYGLWSGHYGLCVVFFADCVVIRRRTLITSTVEL